MSAAAARVLPQVVDLTARLVTDTIDVVPLVATALAAIVMIIATGALLVATITTIVATGRRHAVDLSMTIRLHVGVTRTRTDATMALLRTLTSTVDHMIDLRETSRPGMVDMELARAVVILERTTAEVAVVTGKFLKFNFI